MSISGKISEAIVLAGGQGTRLRSAIGEFPKPMAPINGVPFLQILLDYLSEQGINRVVLSVGYKWEVIQQTFGNTYKNLSVDYAVENEPLGTGGGIRLALEKVQGENVFVLNGDTFFNVSLTEIETLHLEKNAACTLALKKVENGSRYGSISLREDGEIIGFDEKVEREEALINGGVYCLNKKTFNQFTTASRFSFETEFLTNPLMLLYGKIFDSYFKDIGIPEDYHQFEKDQKNPLKIMQGEKLSIDKSWTLFLDRDGVINERLIDDYVKQLNELEIIKNVPEAISFFTKVFGRIVVVTNQQGIGKGMMTADDLSIIHGFIAEVIKSAGGKIDQFYFAPQLKAENSIYRKPGIGMGLQAKTEFPEIDFTKCLMVGDSESDIEFGMKLGMKTVMLKNGRNITTKADYIFENLYQVSQELIHHND